MSHYNGESLLELINDGKIDDNTILDPTYDYKIDYIGNDDNTALMHACWHKFKNLAMQIIITFGDKCKPGHSNVNKTTALMIACHNKLVDVAMKLIEICGDKCKPYQIDNIGNTALTLACYNILEGLAIKLIDTFGDKCKPYHVDRFGSDALLYAKWNNMNRFLKILIKVKIIKPFNILDTHCTICYNELSKRILLVKCGHACYCEDCALKIDVCPLCKSTIDYLVEL
jgi:ankyrin repeat protein